MTMLRVDGDSRDFFGVDLTEDNLLTLGEYFDCPESCYYTIFRKGGASGEMIGHIGFSYREERKRVEAEFYLSKPYRGKGYCREAMEKLIGEVFSGNLSWQNAQAISVQEIHAVTFLSNKAAAKVLEKSGFVKNLSALMLFQLPIDPKTETSSDMICDYVIRVPHI